MAFLHDDFLLTNETARRLYHDYAAAMPIYDYHCHLPPADLSGNRRFTNLHEAWLDGDHYKWRAMRAHGVDEQLITGDAEPYDKFLAFAKTIPSTLRNPLFHWTHLELRRYFGIDVLLNEETARDVWEEANRKLADLPVAAIFTKMKVALVGTIDDPADDLAHHQQLASQSPYPQTTVIPAFRPDRYHVMQDTEAWNDTVDQVGAAAGVKIRKFD
ncbi:MAG: glucuronate isomerase, partial [Planctomycetota bacterium]